MHLHIHIQAVTYIHPYPYSRPSKPNHPNYLYTNIPYILDKMQYIHPQQIIYSSILYLFIPANDVPSQPAAAAAAPI